MNTPSSRFLPKRPWASCMGLLLLPAVALGEPEVDMGACGALKPRNPAQASAAEGVPPLPLPAVPLRRTEKKHPPRPPVIVTKLKTPDPYDWATDTNDINNLLNWMKTQVGVNFTYEAKTLQELELDPSQMPVLYRTGHQPFSFSPEERRRLREFVLGGGMIIFDSCWGSQASADSARSEIRAMLPDHALKPIPLDHPIFNCYHENAGWVRYTEHSLAQKPGLVSPGPSDIEGVEINCRMAVVLSPHDLSCGWDMHTNTFPGGSWIQSEDALNLGANFMAYATASRDLGVSAADAKAYADAERTLTDKFRVGQLVHEGDWNPDPVGLQNLLDTVGQNTALKISFATDQVQPVPEQLSKYPFIYITGHDDFTWSDGQAAAVRQYLANGGFILADSCCGRQKFDVAFRRELGKVLQTGGDSEAGPLQVLPLTHPVYGIHHQIQSITLTEAARLGAIAGQKDRPALEGAAVNGRLAVLYSPLALNVGWRLKPVPYAKGYAPQSALELGVNAVLYAMTQ